MPARRAQVAVYNWMKLKAIQAKAALSTGKDAEKGGAGPGAPGAPQLTADARSPTAPPPAPLPAAPADYTSFRCAPRRGRRAPHPYMKVSSPARPCEEAGCRPPGADERHNELLTRVEAPCLIGPGDTSWAGIPCAAGARRQTACPGSECHSARFPAQTAVPSRLRTLHGSGMRVSVRGCARQVKGGHHGGDQATAGRAALARRQPGARHQGQLSAHACARCPVCSHGCPGASMQSLLTHLASPELNEVRPDPTGLLQIQSLPFILASSPDTEEVSR